MAVEYNFVFVASYINTKVNVVCDSLSRLDDPASIGRIARVDEDWKMCCRQVFEAPFSVALQSVRS